ncbi:MAG TPA: hypothetical protein VMU95_10195 [Trebonia sp.]|nr:hypothetical protein [Trebonia sp.]
MVALEQPERVALRRGRGRGRMAAAFWRRPRTRSSQAIELGYANESDAFELSYADEWL